ncbi:MAG: fatty acid desaturase [Synechococcus sp.]|nr:fatty acid desaturase [Synechococcus sp.]
MSSTTRTGLLLASAILLAWLISLAGLVVVDLAALPWPLLVLAVLLRTQLQTGLFIVGHDAMHGSLWRGRPPWNHRLGALALVLYAALPYGRCCRHHRRHHRAPGTALDPDAPPDPGAGVLAWYLRFMARYLSLPQMGFLLGGWAVLALVSSSISAGSWANVLVFASLPLLLSSLQMFVFGTVLPHRVQCRAEGDAAVESLPLAPIFSLLACYHFSYHSQHHHWPDLAWFELPTRRFAPLSGR